MGGFAFHNVVKTYGSRAVVDGVTLSLSAGRISAIAGVNGSGKTTLFRIGAGFVRPTAGSVSLFRDSETISLAGRSACDRVALGVAYISQERRIMRNISALDNLRAGTSCADVFDALGKARLTFVLDKRPSEMSHGDALWLLLARAHLLQPQVLIADEPFAGLGNRDVEHCIRVFRAMSAAGTAIVLTDHHAGALLHAADTVHIMRSGRIVYSDSAAAAQTSADARRLYFRARA